MTAPSNTSATGGYLVPLNVLPAEDADFDQLLQPVIVGITGLDPTLVRRKWQEVLPPDPDRTVNWCAFGALNEDADTNPTLIHDGADDNGQGTSTSLRTEQFEVMVSFYGPASSSYATALRDGFGISQNREAMRARGLAYVATDRITRVADLRGDAFIRRADLVFRCRRVAIRTYAIRNVDSITGDVVTDKAVTARL